MDYRIISFKNIKEKYLEFLKQRKEYELNNQKNEFEPQYEELQKLYEDLSFVPKTIIIYFFPYYKKIEGVNSNISIHAISKDYHIICKKILEKIRKETISDEYKSYIQCDNGFFNERFFAINSGLCMRGLNGLAIHEKYGSYGFFGLIATDMEMKEYITPLKDCMKCGICLKKCPSNAISNLGINSNICISYLTQKKDLSADEKNLLSKTRKIFGCDICQEVCPHNIGIKNTEIEDFNEDLLYNIVLEDVANLSNKEFKRKYGNRNFSWRGKKIIIRNIELQNEQRNEDS